ncbi:hypothetical protein [Sphingomonas abaci]|uniref:Uncharacterized protein n=1 Tax=Sphingomonas abaci TaxID=237611 RepID=A0A7W7AL07_9SPHN|nr:hypothetical protein [Sphingomonas abaci]MBB4618988.1 hypothetical protein [Sphingomonas abaci]
MSTAPNYDPDLAQAIDDLAPIAAELLAAEKRRDDLPPQTADSVRDQLNEQIEDLLAIFDVRAGRLAMEPDALRLIVTEAARLVGRGPKPSPHDLERALSDMVHVATADDRIAHLRRSRAQAAVERTTRARVAANNALIAFQALRA